MEKTEKQKIKKKFNIYIYFILVLSATLLAALGIIIRNYSVQREAEKEYEKLAATVNRLNDQLPRTVNTELAEETQTAAETGGTSDTEPSGAEKTGIEIPQKTLDWDAMRKLNPDIYAWICIPGTGIDYPVLQHPTDDSYYLKYNMNGTRGYPGCIYTEKLNSRDFTDFDTVLYGHNMRNSSMFADLHDYEVRTFFENNPYVFLYKGDRVFIYEIFAAYKTDDSHILYGNDFESEEGRQAYLDGIVNNGDKNANLRPDIPLSTDSRLVTLSTCVKGESDKRFLVQAVLLNEDDL